MCIKFIDEYGSLDQIQADDITMVYQGNFEQLGPFLRDFLSLTFSEYFSEPNPIFYRVSKVIHTYY
jgi:hypothetical protein